MTAFLETEPGTAPPAKLVLIVDDAANMREMLQYLLEKYHLRVETASNGEEALLRLSNEPVPAAIFVDWTMPRMNGLQFVKTVRADDRYSAMPIIMVSGCQEDDGVKTALEAGVNRFVAKPFRAVVIAEVLQELQVVDSLSPQRVS